MRFHDVERQCEPEASSGNARRLSRLDAMEPLEDAQLVVLRDADAVVDDVDEGFVAASSDPHFDVLRAS
jgi:hypothetical protein